MNLSKKEQLQKLFDEWRVEQHNEPDKIWKKTKGCAQNITKENFCEDGIIDESIFEKETIKVLFITNEANDDSSNIKSSRIDSFENYYKNGKDEWRGKLRQRICCLYKVIIKNYETPEKEFARNFAFMNINKRGGTKTIEDGKHIEEYFKYYSKLIRTEIEIINPDIIIWLGTKTYDMNLHIKYLRAIKKENGTIYFNNIPIIRMWHTSYYMSNYRRLGKFKNCIVDKQAAKLEDELKRYKLS